MAEKVTDIFTSAFQRDVYFKTRDDVGDSLYHVLNNFSQGPFARADVVIPAVVAVAWVLRAALLPIKMEGKKEDYEQLCDLAVSIIRADEVEQEDGR